MSFFTDAAADAAVIVAEVGRDVTFRTASVKAMVSAVPVSVDLATGGFTESGSITVRFLRAAYISAPPKDGERITYAGKVYRISTVTPAEVSAWYEVTAQLLTA